MAAVVRPAGPKLVLSPHDGAMVAARAVLRFHLRSVAPVEASARSGEVEAVHQLRVATRRLRAALRFFEAVLPGRFAEAAHRELAWLARTIGAVRELDVLGVAVRRAAVKLDPDIRAALGPVAILMHDERAAALNDLTAALKSPRCRRLFARLVTVANAAPATRRDRHLGDVAPDLLRPLLRAVQRAGHGLRPESSPADFHRLRVRVKRLRYAVETLRPLGDRAVRRLLDRLERLQEVLGDAQDMASHMDWLRRYAARPDVTIPSLLPVGALIQSFAKRADKRRRRALKAWRKLQRARICREAMIELGGRGGGAHARPRLNLVAS